MGATSHVHKIGNAMTTRTVGVQFRKYAWQYTIPIHNFDTNGILVQLLYGSLRRACWLTLPYGCQHSLCTQIGGSCGALYFRCAILRMRMAVNTPRAELWCKRHFSTTAVGICTICWLKLPYGCQHSLCTQIGGSRYVSYSRCTIPKMHMTALKTLDHTDASGIFIHPLYRSVHSPGVRAVEIPQTVCTNSAVPLHKCVWHNGTTRVEL